MSIDQMVHSTPTRVPPVVGAEDLRQLVAEDIAVRRVFIGPPRRSGSVWWYRPTEVRVHQPKTQDEYRYADEWNGDWQVRGGGDMEIVAKCVDSVGGTITRTVKEFMAERTHPYQQTGFYDFAPEEQDGLWLVERYVRRSPEAAARELFDLRKRENAQSAEARGTE